MVLENADKAMTLAAIQADALTALKLTVLFSNIKNRMKNHTQRGRAIVNIKKIAFKN